MKDNFMCPRKGAKEREIKKKNNRFRVFSRLFAGKSALVTSLAT